MASLSFTTSRAASKCMNMLPFSSAQHLGHQAKNFRAGESEGDPLSSLGSSFQSVCITDQLWMPGNLLGLQEHHHNSFLPTGMSLQNEQDLYLRNFIPQWTM